MEPIKILDVEANLWGKFAVKFTAHPDVNIIVGINGSGKTTLLSEIDKKLRKTVREKNTYIYIPSIDNLAPRDKRKKESALTQELNYYIYDIKEGPSLFKYRISALDASVTYRSIVEERVGTLCELVNSLFMDTGKTVKMKNNRFFFESGEGELSPEELSSGEKQILLLLLRIFLLDENESVVMIDEPENSLDISWQYKLIDLFVRLNPKAQFFITTHSPSIFGDGWGDKIIYIEDVTTKIEKS